MTTGCVDNRIMNDNRNIKKKNRIGNSSEKLQTAEGSGMALLVDNVGMKFNLSKEKVDSLKEYFIKFAKRELKYDEFYITIFYNFSPFILEKYIKYIKFFLIKEALIFP